MANEDIEDDYIFSDEEYITACDLAQAGKTKQLKHFLSRTLQHQKVGAETFSPDVAALDVVARRLSPLTYAARSGRVDTVRFLLKQYGKFMAINPGLENYRKDPLYKKEVRHDLPIYWACLNGHLEVVKLLVSSRAVITMPNCMLATALHAAAFNGHLAVVEYLISKDAGVNARDIFQSTPLLAAAQGGNLKTVDYLLQKGADPLVVNLEGFTVIHVAALHGHHLVVKALLDRGLSPLYQDALLSATSEMTSDPYVPCPLFLAAANGHFDVVCTFLNERDCPPHVESDAHMLLGVGLHEVLHRGVRVRLPKGALVKKTRRPSEYPREIIEGCWLRGVGMRLDHTLSIDLPRIKSYGNEKEMNSAEEVLATSQDITRNVYQSLLILERCLGPGHPLIVQSCIDHGDSHLVDMSLYQAIHRVLQNSIARWNKEKERSFYRDPISIHSTLENFLHRLVPWSRGASLYHIGDTPTRDYVRYMDIALNMLDILIELREMHKCEGDSVQSVLSALLYFFASWLQTSYQASLYTSLCTIDKYIGPDDCEILGKKLVTNHLDSLEGTTLLHMTLNDSRLLKASRSKRYTWKNGVACADLEVDLGLLLYALLRWGADIVLDVFDWNGQRPLHLAVILTEEDRAHRCPTKHNVIKPLVQYGAHLDYINKEGKTPRELCQSDTTRNLLTPPGPRPLTCLACVKIIDEKIAYQDMLIPQRIKKLIRNHHGKS
jgi:Fem-1 family protein b